MRLVDALRLGTAPSVALVGAGGKTTALFALGEDLLARPGIDSVLLAATTHLGTWQAQKVAHHFVITRDEQLRTALANLPDGLVLCTGPQTTDQRLSGLEAQWLEALHDFSRQRCIPLLLECDGSRQRPLKAPAQHEPVIPPWVEMVVLVAGLGGVGLPLVSDTVHRPEIFAELSGLRIGETITPSAVEQVLLHPHGGLKSIPPAARRVVLLNQADTVESQAIANRLAQGLLVSFTAVIVASCQQTDPVYAVYERVAGVILAAGESSRLGRAKQLLPWRGQPLVRHVAHTGLQAGLHHLLVVTGAAALEVNAAMQDLPVTQVFNADWRVGQGTSVASGVRALPPQIGAAIFLLCDQPQTPAALLRGLIELHAATLSPIVAPQVQGERANPVLFDRITFPELSNLSGEAGGRALFSRYPPTWLPWHDPFQLLDIDSEQDYQRLLELE